MGSCTGLNFATTLIDEIDSILTIDHLDTYIVAVGDLGGLEGLTTASYPPSITIAPDCDRQSLTLAHEIGHMVEFSKNLTLFTQSSELNELIWAAQESSRVKWYEMLIGSQSAPGVRRFATSLLQPAEIWARNFAQFIASQLPSTAIATDLDRLLSIDSKSHILDYWDPLDFEPIADAMELILLDWGWL